MPSDRSGAARTILVTRVGMFRFGSTGTVRVGASLLLVGQVSTCEGAVDVGPRSSASRGPGVSVLSQVENLPHVPIGHHSPPPYRGCTPPVVAKIHSNRYPN